MVAGTRWAYFYPRPPRGGRQLARVSVSQHNRFLSPPSARRATYDITIHCESQQISIPALREEGDLSGKDAVLFNGISIPALREEGDSYG